MRWFKHFSDNHRGQSVQLMLDEMGYFGPFFYYLIYELCSEKLEVELGAEVLPEGCVFRFHQRVVCSASRAKPSTVGRALVLGQSCGLWSFSLDGVYIEIKTPILSNLLDRDMKKPRLRRAQTAPSARLDKSRIDKEEDIICSEPQKADQSKTKKTFKFSEFEADEFVSISWIGLYNAEYIKREYAKIGTWLIANPQKNKRSEKGWIQFISNWLERGWNNHLKQAPIEQQNAKRIPKIYKDEKSPVEDLSIEQRDEIYKKHLGDKKSILELLPNKREEKDHG